MHRDYILRRPTKPFIVIGPSIAYIPLTKGQFALIESDDVPLVESRRWCASWNKPMRTFYAMTTVRRSGRSRCLFLHRFLIFPQGSDFLVDHKNPGYTLDCRRHNLRPATPSQNSANRGIEKRNSSGFKGVTWHKSTQRWRATLTHNSKHNHIGSFKNPEEAYAAYCAAALRFHGEFANFGIKAQKESK